MLPHYHNKKNQIDTYRYIYSYLKKSSADDEESDMWTAGQHVFVRLCNNALRIE